MLRAVGFKEGPENHWSEGIRRVVAEEAAHGLNIWPRVVMERAATRPPA